MASKLVPTNDNPFIFPISDKIKEEVVKQDVRSQFAVRLQRSFFITPVSATGLERILPSIWQCTQSEYSLSA